MVELLMTTGLLASILSVTLFVLWFMLPFAVFGIKGKLDKLISLLEDIEGAGKTIG